MPLQIRAKDGAWVEYIAWTNRYIRFGEDPKGQRKTGDKYSFRLLFISKKLRTDTNEIRWMGWVRYVTSTNLFCEYPKGQRSPW